jgi:outer membrane protein TolC
MHRSATLFRSIIITCVILSAALAIAGCRSVGGEKIRSDHAESYPVELATRTDEILAAHQRLNLDDCIRIALKSNLDVRSSQIHQRIATLERKIAFANFLPVLDVGYMHYEFDPAIALELSDATLRIDKVRTVTWQANMSIFNPATWFLYAMHRRGAEIAELVTTYTKQMTVLQTTVLYYHCLSLEEMDRALSSELEAALETERRLQSLRQEELVSSWQADQAKVLVQARRLEQQRTRRELRRAKADLLVAMGLSPLADIALTTQTSLEAPDGDLEDLIAEALLRHPNLRIADRNIEIQKEQVKVAISNFLPRLFGFATYPDSIDDFVDTSGQWIYGLSATMTLFNGFANVNEYKAARQRREESFLQREQASLAVILEVVRAHLMLETAAEQAALAQSVQDVTAGRVAEAEQKWREGLIDSSEMLDLTAQRDKARVQAIAAKFQHQVGIATLLNVMRKTTIDIEEPEHDGAS